MDRELIEALFQVSSSSRSHNAVLFRQVYAALVEFCRVANFDWPIDALHGSLNTSTKGKAVKVDILARPGSLPENALYRPANCVYWWRPRVRPGSAAAASTNSVHIR